MQPLRRPWQRFSWIARVAGTLLVPAICGCAPRIDPRIEDPHARVTRYLDALIADGREVGLQYVVVSDQGVVLDYAGGIADAATGQPVTPETTFLTASMTKVLTAAAVLRLVGNGRVELDAPLSRYVPRHPYGTTITVRQLLNHSSGVPNPLPLRWVHRLDERDRFDEARALERVLAENPELDASPGEEYAYSNLGYWLLGRVIESASGRPYCEFLRAEVFEPLGIPPAALDCDVTALGRHARGHQARWSFLGLILPFITESAIWAEPAGKWARFQHLRMNGIAYGGVVGTARGYATFLHDLLQPEPRLLDGEGVHLFFSEQRSATGEILPTTLGWHRGTLDGVPYFSKPGGGPGFSGNLRVYRDRRLATVFLSNRMRVREAELQEFSDRLDREILQARAQAGVRAQARVGGLGERTVDLGR